jgi:uncharacterized membrane protein YbhN (UPF0104 family)
VADVPSTRSRTKAASGIVGLLLAGVAFAFVARTLLRDREAIGDALAEAEPEWLVVGFVLAVTGMVAIALPWRRALRLVGGDLPMGQVVARYFVGEIGKYIPGGVWPVLGRGELARRRGVGRGPAYGSVALSLVALYLAAMFVVVALLPALLTGDDGTGPVAVVLLLPVGLVALHPRVLRGALSFVERVTRRHVELALPSWGQSLGLLARYVPAWLAIGSATWAVARALDPQADAWQVIAAAVLSWVVGFVLVPVPGGVGVREAAFVAAAGSLDPGIAAATALAARAGFVVVDAIGAAIGGLALRRGGEAVVDDRSDPTDGDEAQVWTVDAE